MSAKECFDKIIKAYKENDDALFRASIKNLFAMMDEGLQSPYPPNVPERDLLFTARKYYTKWKTKSIDGRSSKVRMVETFRKLLEKNDRNPFSEEPITTYQPSTENAKSEEKHREQPTNESTVEELPEERLEALKKLREAAKSMSGPTKVLGIVPEDPKKTTPESSAISFEETADLRETDRDIDSEEEFEVDPYEESKVDPYEESKWEDPAGGKFRFFGKKHPEHVE